MQLRPTPHAQQRMDMRGIGTANIQAVLRDGECIARQKFRRRAREKYSLLGLNVVVVRVKRAALVITAYYDDQPGRDSERTTVSRGATRKEARKIGSRQYYRGVSKS